MGLRILEDPVRAGYSHLAGLSRVELRSTCTRTALRDYLDGTRGTFRTGLIPPTEQQFAQGARWFACIVRVEGTVETTVSLRDR